MKHIVQAVSIRWYNACAYYAVSLARGLVKNGHRVTVAGISETPAIIKAEDAKLDTLSLLPVNKGFVAQLKRAAQCRRFALENEVSLVNAHAGEDHLIWAIALRGTGIPLVRTSGNQIPPNNHIAARVLLRKTAGVIASCGTIRNFYSDGFGIAADDIPVINGGVDSEYFNNDAKPTVQRSDFAIPDDAYLFGMLARYSPDKGHEHFFKAAGAVAQREPSARFLVAGWKAQLSENDMRRMADANGILDRTVFVGRQKDTRGLIALLDAGVIASVNSETICRIAMEYMSMGVPVVSTDTNVIPEVVVDGDTGLVAPAGDAEKMAAAMLKLMGDKSLGARLGSNGIRRIHDVLSLESFAAKTYETYESFLS